MKSLIMAAIAALFFASLAIPANAMNHKQTQVRMNVEQSVEFSARRKHHRRHHHARRSNRGSRVAAIDANGNATTQVCDSGRRHCVSVAASAQATLQCVVNHVEASGVRVTALGGIRRGHCSTSSMHPCGKAIDINQTARDRNGPPRSVSSSAASACGAVSGSWWAGNPDNGHFQVGGWAGTHEHGTTYAARRHHRRHYARL